jgi:hypothetical protein
MGAGLVFMKFSMFLVDASSRALAAGGWTAVGSSPQPITASTNAAAETTRPVNRQATGTEDLLVILDLLAISEKKRMKPRSLESIPPQQDLHARSRRKPEIQAFESLLAQGYAKTYVHEGPGQASIRTAPSRTCSI